jgi:Cu(I)/Ag(I) efflux system membrane fusion protein
MMNRALWSLLIWLGGIAFSPSLQAQTATKVEYRFKVYGNCGACEERILEALDQKGIVAARWDRAKQEAWVVYRPSKISEDQIQHFVAAAGHDTEHFKADTAVYQSLPGCCLYREKHSPH